MTDENYWSSCRISKENEEWVPSWERAMVDSMICAEAVDFLGMNNDYFTQYVFIKRALNHIPNDRNFK